jgi:hypothetical protein
VRQEIARRVHDADPRVVVFDGHVNVEAEDQDLPHHVLHLVLDHLVAVQLGDPLVLPVGEGVRAGRGDPHALGLQQRGERAAQAQDLLARLGDAGADLGADLHDRLEHLRLDVLTQDRLGGRQQGVDVGLELAVRADDLELLFDADRQWVCHRCHRTPPHAPS